jgi:hypothetical protein
VKLDLSGSDYGRLKTKVRHEDFVEEPHSGPGKRTFAVRKKYLGQMDPEKVVCREVSHVAGVLLMEYMNRTNNC